MAGQFVNAPDGNPGLHGQPHLLMNSLQPLCAGLLQIMYGLWHNRSIAVWRCILSGPAAYTPPVCRDVAIHEATPVPARHAMTHEENTFTNVPVNGPP